MLTERGVQIFASYGTLLVISSIVLILRVYVRASVIKSFGLEDWTTVLGWAFFVAFTGVISIAIRYGFNTDPPTMTSIVFVLKSTFVAGPLYIVAGMLVKFSIAVMLLRFVTFQTTLRRILYIAIGVYEIGCVVIIFLAVFQCRPIQFYWTKFQGATNGHCFDHLVVVVGAYVYSGLTCMIDLTLAILPWFLVRRMQTASLGTKVMVATILGMGSIASVATIGRMVYTYKILHAPSFTSAATNFLILTYVELGLAIIASSAATLKPLISKSISKKSSKPNDLESSTLIPSYREKQEGQKVDGIKSETIAIPSSADTTSEPPR